MDLFSKLLAALFAALGKKPVVVETAPVENDIDIACKFIAKWEGCRLVAYADIVGKMTIGYGRTTNVNEGDVISQEQADNWLREEVETFMRGVRSVITRPMTANQAAAFCSLAYNVGLAAFRGSTAARKFNDGDLLGAKQGILLYNRAGGKIVQGLINRRNAEVALFDA